ncbi:MAG: hypothetical protein HQL91_03390 [Magnetococcales bacterium]|nr:hypothetical protein [Magnetococcales bacterium]
MDTLADLITQRLEAKEKLFAARGEFFKIIGAPLTRRLGVTPTDPLARLTEALRTHCPERFRLAQGGRTIYVALNLPDEAFLRAKARKFPALFTPAQLALNLPMAKPQVAFALTQLLESGEVTCVALRADFTPLLRWIGARPPPAVPHQSATPEDDRAFHQAFLELGQGRNFVAIHRLRSQLGWERTRFDQTLIRLRAAERILLNMGDPTRLSRAELDNAFQDDNGMRYLTLNWLGSTP